MKVIHMLNQKYEIISERISKSKSKRLQAKWFAHLYQSFVHYVMRAQEPHVKKRVILQVNVGGMFMILELEEQLISLVKPKFVAGSIASGFTNILKQQLIFLKRRN